MSRIELKNIKKIYDNGFEAVKGIDLTIEEGTFVVFVGSSGCGKTTTLRMIAGLESVTEGEILVDGENINNLHPKDRDLAMVFQNYALYPHMTVYDNMAYPLKLRKMDKKVIDEKVKSVAKQLELDQYLRRKPSQLSGGQNQRVALGRCIVREPKAFLMDEPLSNLDAKLRVTMRNEITDLQKSMKKTFIYVTHDQVEAMTMGDKIVVMSHGEIMQEGKPEELYQDPDNLFVAGFIGSPSMNFIEGGNASFNLGEAVFDVNYREDFVLGFRPEAISIESGDFEFTAIISNIEKLGAENYIHVRIDSIQLVIRDFTKTPLEIGSQRKFYLDKDRLYFFDKKTEERIREIKVKNLL